MCGLRIRMSAIKEQVCLALGISFGIVTLAYRGYCLNESIPVASAGLEEDSRLQLLFVGVVGCVAKGTEVLMTEGDEKKVEDLRVGDKILSWDVERGHLVEGTIVSFKTDKSHDPVGSNRELIVSPRQLVYTQSGWRSASELDERYAIGMLNDRNELTFVAITTISKVNR